MLKKKATLHIDHAEDKHLIRGPRVQDFGHRFPGPDGLDLLVSQANVFVKKLIWLLGLLSGVRTCNREQQQ